MNKFFSICSLAKKANLLRHGSEFCIEYVKSGKAELVVIAFDTANRQKQSLISECERSGVSYIAANQTKDTLGNVIGTRPVGAFCICDKGLADKAMQLYKVSEDGGMIYEYNS